MISYKLLKPIRGSFLKLFNDCEAEKTIFINNCQIRIYFLEKNPYKDKLINKGFEFVYFKNAVCYALFEKDYYYKFYNDNIDKLGLLQKIYNINETKKKKFNLALNSTLILLIISLLIGLVLGIVFVSFNVSKSAQSYIQTAIITFFVFSYFRYTSKKEKKESYMLFLEKTDRSIYKKLLFKIYDTSKYIFENYEYEEIKKLIYPRYIHAIIHSYIKEDIGFIETEELYKEYLKDEYLKKEIIVNVKTDDKNQEYGILSSGKSLFIPVIIIDKGVKNAFYSGYIEGIIYFKNTMDIILLVSNNNVTKKEIIQKVNEHNIENSELLINEDITS